MSDVRGGPQAARSAGHETCVHQTYSLSCADFEVLLARADGHCERCGKPAAEAARGKLYIDHEHRVGHHAVRGLLCHGCNQILARVDSARLPLDPASARYLRLSGMLPGTDWEALRAATSDMPKRSQVYSLRLPRVAAQKFEDLAAQRGVTPSALIRQLVEARVEAERHAAENRVFTVRTDALRQALLDAVERAATGEL